MPLNPKVKTKCKNCDDARGRYCREDFSPTEKRGVGAFAEGLEFLGRPPCAGDQTPGPVGTVRLTRLGAVSTLPCQVPALVLAFCL